MNRREFLALAILPLAKSQAYQLTPGLIEAYNDLVNSHNGKYVKSMEKLHGLLKERQDTVFLGEEKAREWHQKLVHAYQNASDGEKDHAYHFMRLGDEIFRMG